MINLVPADAVPFIAIGALALIVFVVLASVLIASRRWDRERLQHRRALNQALSMVDAARGIALDQTHVIAWRDRRDEPAMHVANHPTQVLRL